MLGIMGRMADYTGQVLTWDQAINSKHRLAPASYAFDAVPPVVRDKDGNYPAAYARHDKDSNRRNLP